MLKADSFRVCAVSGGTYILGRDIVDIEYRSKPASDNEEMKRFCLKLADIPEDITADAIISSMDYLPRVDSETDSNSSESHVYCIALIDGAITQPASSETASATDNDSTGEPVEGTSRENTPRPVDASLVVFPPGSLSAGKALGPVNVLINGEGTLSCPRGKSEFLISLPDFSLFTFPPKVYCIFRRFPQTEQTIWNNFSDPTSKPFFLPCEHAQEIPSKNYPAPSTSNLHRLSPKLALPR